MDRDDTELYVPSLTDLMEEPSRICGRWFPVVTQVNEDLWNVSIRSVVMGQPWWFTKFQQLRTLTMKHHCAHRRGFLLARGTRRRGQKVTVLCGLLVLSPLSHPCVSSAKQLFIWEQVSILHALRECMGSLRGPSHQLLSLPLKKGAWGGELPIHNSYFLKGHNKL